MTIHSLVPSDPDLALARDIVLDRTSLPNDAALACDYLFAYGGEWDRHIAQERIDILEYQRDVADYKAGEVARIKAERRDSLMTHLGIVAAAIFTVVILGAADAGYQAMTDANAARIVVERGAP